MITKEEIDELTNLPNEYGYVHISWLEGGEELGCYKIIDKGYTEKPEYDFITRYSCKFTDIVNVLRAIRKCENKSQFEICVYF